MAGNTFTGVHKLTVQAIDFPVVLQSTPYNEVVVECRGVPLKYSMTTETHKVSWGRSTRMVVMQISLDNLQKIPRGARLVIKAEPKMLVEAINCPKLKNERVGMLTVQMDEAQPFELVMPPAPKAKKRSVSATHALPAKG